MANQFAAEPVHQGKSNSYPEPKKRFRCYDVGYRDCAWQFEGHTTEEMLPVIRQHASKVHHLELKEEAIRHVRNAIHDAA
jgi:predicted small metal-binding protein